MGLTFTMDPSGRRLTANLAPDEAAAVVGALADLRALRMAAGRSGRLSAPLEAVDAGLLGVIRDARMSGSGQPSEPVTSELAATGQDWIGSVELAEILHISARSARRVAARRGVKVGARWVVRRAEIGRIAGARA